MTSDGDSFLPRIQSVFYATFDDKKGRKIVYQVPEGLIGASPLPGESISSSDSPVFSPSPTPTTPVSEAPKSRTPSISLASPEPLRTTLLSIRSPQKRTVSNISSKYLFNFNDISKYVIPPPALCGRLVTCATRNHRLIGYPVELRGKYERVYFRCNLCFVFERQADLSCYEPIIRKIARVFTACEEESGFLSSPQKSAAIPAILEQLYEDLNSYSETSISIDAFNSIELKIFPFYPNPTPVKDWMVPVALINLSRRIEPNWDLTMVKVCEHIDGVNHVSRIAHLADCDLDLAREAISHLLYYQVIMMIDIFQYSNMYTLRKSVQWLADEPHVKDECGPYVTRTGKPVPDWPKLLHLYSRLKVGKTVFEWMQEHDVLDDGIDVRRFTSFGVIKGFLRRVHRWPILLKSSESPSNGHSRQFSTSSIGRKSGKNLSMSWVSSGQSTPAPPSPDEPRSRAPKAPPTLASVSTELAISNAVQETLPAPPLLHRGSAAAQSLEQLRRRGTVSGPILPKVIRAPSQSRTPYRFPPLSGQDGPNQPRPEQRRHSMVLQTPFFSAAISLAGSKKTAHGLGQGDYLPHHHPLHPQETGLLISGSTLPLGHASRPRLSRSPSSGMLNLSQPPTTAMLGSCGIAVAAPAYPPAMLTLLDGEHHTDELCSKFEVGWPLLEQWLIAAGDGKGDGDYGRVAIIHR